MSHREATIDVTPFRHAISAQLARGVPASELCLRAGYVQRSGKGDTTRLKRAAGLAPDRRGKAAVLVTPDTALRLVRALAADPVDFAL